jgi:hypothetical protein
MKKYECFNKKVTGGKSSGTPNSDFTQRAQRIKTQSSQSDVLPFANFAKTFALFA